MKKKLFALSMIFMLSASQLTFAESGQNNENLDTPVLETPSDNENNDINDEHNTKEFEDILADAWYAEAVHFVNKREIMRGVSETEFDPDGPATRGMLALIITNMNGETEKVYWSYLDVKEDKWYADAVAWCSESGVMKGYGEGKFGPDDNITREQLVSTLYRFAQYKNFGNLETNGVELLAYKDYADISGYAGGPMQWALKNDIISGNEDKMLESKRVASRAEIAQIIRNFMVFYNL